MPNSTLKKKIFTDHYDYYTQTGIETIKQQAGQVEQVSSDYEGRVIFELLQNAFDKADKNILVKSHNNALYIANDGIKFKYTAEYNYREGGTTRGDFQSLCSISTSTKEKATSIGNKGVGFKSVFSIAKGGYVNIYTQAEIISNDETLFDTLNFRIYDSFKNTAEIPEQFDENVKNTLHSHIPQIQKEQANRGVPGFYFPLYIEEEPEFIQQLFQDGYVTVIEIPVDNESSLNELIAQIKKIHFNFVGLKYLKPFDIKFDVAGEIFVHQVVSQPGRLYSYTLDSDEIRNLAHKAGIEISNPTVGFSIRDNAEGYLYNYLPTEVRSPFPFIDFHADFHTTVDRKNINFDSTIGDYNKALLNSCIELYWSVLRCYLDPEDRIDLKLNYLDQIDFGQIDFTWNLVKYSKVFVEKMVSTIRDLNMKILMINEQGGNFAYSTACSLFAMLAKKYFKSSRTVQDYDAFYDHVQVFINENSTNKAHYTAPIINFKTQLAKTLINKEVKILPDVSDSKGKEIILRKSEDKELDLPDFLGITITNYQIDKFHGAELKKGLGIADFSDYNVMLKYFKQCKFSGRYAEESITEKEQQDLVRSLFQIFILRNEQAYESAHRFTLARNTEKRDKNSAVNQAAFSVSTVFLKTIKATYKPAQLCTVDEICNDFLEAAGIDPLKSGTFLKYLGVSAEPNILFADGRIYDQLKGGLSLPPALYNKTYAEAETITELLIKHFYVINKAVKIHPSVINDNAYGFLDRFNNEAVKPNLDILLVKNYQEFPTPYRKILKEKINGYLINDKEDVVRLYQSIFHIYHQDSDYLISKNGKLSWTIDKNFKVVNTKTDFDLLIHVENLSILCYYGGQRLPVGFDTLVTKRSKGEITIDSPEPDTELKTLLLDRMVYLLVMVSESQHSQLNFLEDANLDEIRTKVNQLEIHLGKNLKQQIKFDEIEVLSDPKYAFDHTLGPELYLLDTSSYNQKALGLAEYLFSNISLAATLQEALFQLELEELKERCGTKNIEIISSKWKLDYLERFNAFQDEICQRFSIAITDKWFIYDKNYRSESLIQIDQQGQLNALRSHIEFLKDTDTYLGYFDDFELRINLDHNVELAAELLTCIRGKEEEQTLVERINQLSRTLNTEKQLDDIKDYLTQKYGEYDQAINKDSKNNTIKQLALYKKIEDIYSSITMHEELMIDEVALNGSGTTSNIAINDLKTIYQKNGNNGTVEEQELTGATGEEKVLNHYIREFLKLSPDDRAIGIHQTYLTLALELGNDTHLQYRDNCLAVIDSTPELIRALIPFFYVALHHKYSYFDLIVYKNNTPTLVEVKSTKGNQNKFFISIAEVNAARKSANYELVRVAGNRVTFIGNPIRSIDQHIHQIKGDNYSLSPRTYEFDFKK
jgi:hypothetical protein